MTTNPDAPGRALGRLAAENAALRQIVTETKSAAEANAVAQQTVLAQRQLIAELQEQLYREKVRNEALLESTSWRLTAPVRLAKTLLQSKRKTDAAERVTPLPRSRAASVADVASGACPASPADCVITVLVATDVPLDDEGLYATIESLRDQSLREWQLVVVAFAPLHRRAHWAGWPPSVNDPRIVVVPDMAPSRGAALQAATARANGRFVLPLNTGDALVPHALMSFADRVGTDPQLDIVYADEAILCRDCAVTPQFKPGWSPDLLAAYDYFGRPTIVRRGAIDAVGGFADDLGAASEWDLHLRVAGSEIRNPRTRRIGRVTDVLCHRPACQVSRLPLPDDPDSDDFREALRRHYQREGIDATVATCPDGTQHARWTLPDPPLVSVIVLNKDNGKLLRDCLDGLLSRTLYPCVEIIVVDNGSTDPGTLNICLF